jgi:hypothetical protein
LNRFLDRYIQDSLSNMVAPENKLRLHHGRGWGSGGPDSGSSEGTFQQASSETLVPFETVLKNDIAALPGFITTFGDGIVAQMKTNIYATVSAAADRSGFTVSMKEAGSPAQAFLRMLETIEFAVNAKGEVTLPAVHLSPSMHQRMLDDLQAQGPEFKAEVERIKQVKSAEALQREQERLDRYRK